MRLLRGKRPATTLHDVQRVRAGLPFRAFEQLERESGLSRDQLASFVGIPKRTLSRRSAQGRLRSDESDRVLQAARVFAAARTLFEGNADAARRWLCAAHPALGGETPLALAATSVGAREVEALIGRLEHGVFT
jgi:putative toxin-antitoxin system antitoxin component (TIGR02293 family)